MDSKPARPAGRRAGVVAFPMANIVILAGSPIDQPQSAFIEFASVGKVFRTKSEERIEAIRDISFKVEKNQFITIVGPSGCGKSTLLKMIAGLMTPSSGRIIVHSENHEAHANAGMVLQRPALLPWRNVLGNILCRRSLSAWIASRHWNARTRWPWWGCRISPIDIRPNSPVACSSASPYAAHSFVSRRCS